MLMWHHLIPPSVACLSEGVTELYCLSTAWKDLSKIRDKTDVDVVWEFVTICECVGCGCVHIKVSCLIISQIISSDLNRKAMEKNKCDKESHKQSMEC